MLRFAKKTMCALLSSFLFSCNAFAQCDGMKGGSTMQSACLNAQKALAVDERTKKLLASLERSFEKSPQPEYNKLVLRISQESWEVARDKQCDLEQLIRGGIESVSYARCKQRMALEREATLRSLLPQS